MSVTFKAAAIRFLQSGLIKEFDSIDSCLKHHFGIQAQMKTIPYTTIALRTKGTTVKCINNSIMNDKKIVRLWGLRNTLHYYSVDDWNLLCNFLQEKPDWFERRMRKKGIDFDQLLSAACDILNENPIITREIMLKNGISSEYLGPWGDLFISLNNRGYICNISDGKGPACYANRSTWAPNIKHTRINYNDALCEIVVRFFSCYGPAQIHDLLHWLGYSISNSSMNIMNTMCSQIDSLMEYEPGLWGLKNYFSLYNNIDAVAFLEDHTFILGKFDPLLLAYNDKSWIVSDEFKKLIWRKAGHISGTVVENGLACATWDYKIKDKCLFVIITKFKECQIEINRVKSYFIRIANLYECKKVECMIMGLDNQLDGLYQMEVKSE